MGEVHVIGVATDRPARLDPEARAALAAAQVLVGGTRHLAAFGATATAATVRIEIAADADRVAREVRRQSVDEGRRVCVLASGDPGFFGILRALSRTIDRASLRVHPAPSAVSVAFARLGIPWDDAAVVSAHGRPLPDAIAAIRGWPKVAVLTSPESPPEAIGKALAAAGTTFDLVAVCSRLGLADESVTETDLGGLAAGRFDPLSVVVLAGPGGLPPTGWGPGDRPALVWGLPDAAFAHHMITRAEVRWVVLGKLALPATGVLWDIGAGSGSVAIECAMARPSLTVVAVERATEAAGQIAANVASFGAGVHLVQGEAPAVLAGLPAPDRVFGGGGIAVLEAALGRLTPGGRVVATFAALERAAEAAALLGNLVQVSVSQGERLPDGGLRLAARNPVFVTWGPDA
jgi:precorrin-6Y C5,15-methyltransferase (decarboxylating)